MGLRDLLDGGIFGRDRRTPEERRFGTGLWRQHRDRFSRSVDRFFETAQALHAEFGEAGETHVPEDVVSDAPTAAAVEAVSRLTFELNDLDERVATLMERCQREVPLEDLVLPADGRRRLGDVPEAVSRAASLVAQAAQTAAMLRAHLRMADAAGTSRGSADRLGEFPRSAQTYVQRAADTLAAAEAGLPAS
ncbi:hypothetical protein [Brevibacterium album]|uniref:hypothetical protein n=1 Tax=Brevibacterium album TaxID=417948 RepID=UPI00041D0BE0|nr:hypothetical protein [Brevibacterium album]